MLADLLLKQQFEAPTIVLVSWEKSFERDDMVESNLL